MWKKLGSSLDEMNIWSPYYLDKKQVSVSRLPPHYYVVSEGVAPNKKDYVTMPRLLSLFPSFVS